MLEIFFFTDSPRDFPRWKESRDSDNGSPSVATMTGRVSRLFHRWSGRAGGGPMLRIWEPVTITAKMAKTAGPNTRDWEIQ